MNQENQNQLTEREQTIAQLIGIGAVFAAFGLLLYLRIQEIIPGPEKIVSLLETLYARHGYSVVLISALIEGIFLLNYYFPGSSAILLGVIFASRSGLSVPLVIALAVSGFFISYSINYFIGRHGISRLVAKFGYGQILTQTEKELRAKGPKMIFSSYFHPNLAVLVSVGAGVIRMPYWQFAFASLGSLIFWDTAWGLLAHALGEQVLKLFESWLIFPVMALWTLLALYPIIRRTRQLT